MVIKWITASALGLGGQCQPAVLALIAQYMEAPIQSDDSYGFFHSFLRHDWLVAYGTLGSELLVKVLNAVDLVRCIYGEGHSVQALVTHNASEALNREDN